MSIKIELNINTNITVKLSEYGIKIWNDYHHPHQAIFPVNEDGTITTELHSLMYIFGQFLFVGNKHGSPFIGDLKCQ